MLAVEDCHRRTTNESREHSMRKTIGVVAASAVIIGGAGTVAVAASGTTPTPSSSSSSVASDSPATGSSTKAGKHRGQARLRVAVHVTWVSRNKKTKTFTTHEAIRGHVSAVSPTSVTVKAADGVTESFVVSSATTVHTRGNKAAASIADVKIGDPVRVAGTGTTTLTAKRVMDAKK
jgi:hypothetical protein